VIACILAGGLKEVYMVQTRRVYSASQLPKSSAKEPKEAEEGSVSSLPLLASLSWDLPHINTAMESWRLHGGNITNGTKEDRRSKGGNKTSWRCWHSANARDVLM